MAATRHGGGDRTTLLVPPQSGRAIDVRESELVRVIDVEGQQVGDLWVIDANDHDRWLSTSHTRDRLERLFPRVGEQFTDQFGKPILEFVADGSPGKHDMLFPPCNRWLYEREGLLDHPNCLDNFVAAAASVGVFLPVVPRPGERVPELGPCAGRHAQREHRRLEARRQRIVPRDAGCAGGADRLRSRPLADQQQTLYSAGAPDRPWVISPRPSANRPAIVHAACARTIG